MYLMLGDEADADQGRGQHFFIYGAIFVPVESLQALNGGVEAIRVAAKFDATDSLKFADKTRPKKISKETFRDVKAQIMALAAKHGVVFCAYAILHAIASNEGHKQLVLFGANTPLGSDIRLLNAGASDYRSARCSRIRRLCPLLASGTKRG